jgi:copper homeostasis protein
MSRILEIAVFNIDSAIAAAEAGADRLELCENPQDGGTTPSYGFMKTVRELVSIPVFPIIRPHGGDFLYSNPAFRVMQKDIALAKELGFEGVVLGLLKSDGTIDSERTAQLVEQAYPMEVTFHRAFDRAKDPLEALATIIQTGCSRILTSGQQPNAFDAKDLIQQLVQQASDRIIIMPGSGVRASNIQILANFTGAQELHSSARKLIPSSMEFQVGSMQESLQNCLVDPAEIQAMKSQLIA